jgi:hypothetical protein
VSILSAHLYEEALEENLDFMENYLFLFPRPSARVRGGRLNRPHATSTTRVVDVPH